MKILLVKLGALGDVLRTTTVLSGLKKKYPGARISWVVEERNREALERNALVDEVLILEREIPAMLANRRFDMAINLDKERPALDTIMAANAAKKLGFGRSSSGDVCALDEKSDYAYRLGVDDELKFHQNQKTYQSISFEQAGLDFLKEEYVFETSKEDREWAKKYLATLGVRAGSGRPIVGLNTGAGKRFAGKILPDASCLELAQKFSRGPNAVVLLLGGPEEVERNRRISALSRGAAVNTGEHSLSRFASLVALCGVVVSGDTTAMHVAIAMKVPVAVYFASTCSAEIELYGRGEKIVSKISCAPCYKKTCPIDEQCMKDMDVEAIYRAACKFLPK